MNISDGQIFDAVIVGAGPAGSSLAIRLSKVGKRILLIDKAKFPRHKLCGEFVSPECLTHVRELGIESAISDKFLPEISETRFYTKNGRSLTIPNKWLSTSERNAIGISRILLDQILVDRARSCGAVVLEEVNVEGPITSDSKLKGLKVRIRSGEQVNVFTDFAIDATGRSRALSRLFEPGESSPMTGQVAFKTHLNGARIAKDVCEIYSFPGGYGGCSQVEDGIYNLCYVVDSSVVRQIGNDRDEIFRKIYLQNRRAFEVLSDSQPTIDWITVSIPRFGRSKISPFPGVLAIGDAAGFIDPFTGSGIALALQTSKLCFDTICTTKEFESLLEIYGRNYGRAVRGRMGFCKVVRTLARLPSLADHMISLISRFQGFGHFAARATRAGSAD